jgi:hypothetical protein
MPFWCFLRGIEGSILSRNLSFPWVFLTLYKFCLILNAKNEVILDQAPHCDCGAADSLNLRLLC